MPQALTRRRDHVSSMLESWIILYGDVNVGRIGLRAGVPKTVPQWGWHVGFYPVSHRGLRHDGTATTFDEARAAFERAWSAHLPQCTDADFDEHRFQRAFIKWRYRMWSEGHQLPTQTVSGMSKCFCGALINNRTSVDHIRARHM